MTFPENVKPAPPSGEGGLHERDRLGERINPTNIFDPNDSPVLVSAAAVEIIGKDNAAKLSARSDFEYRVITEINLGEQYRKDPGDITGLAVSIQRNGLLHPPVINSDGTLIAGGRRLAALRMIYGDNAVIPVRVVAIQDVLRGQAAENFDRKDFTLSEAVAIKRAIEPEVRAAAKERQSVAGKHKAEAPAKLAEASKGEAREKIAAFTGVKRTTLAKAEAIVAAAEAEPEKYGRLVDAMDRTGRANGPYQRMQVLQQAEAIRSAPPAIPGSSPLTHVVIDYPWPNETDADQNTIDAHGRSLRPYPAMAIEAGLTFMADQLAPRLALVCVVGMWSTNYHLPFAFQMLRAMGFESHATVLTWVKDKMGRGQVLRDKTEHCIIATRGKVLVHLTNETTELRAPRRENSRKPDEFYDLFERVFPSTNYAEIFSRGGRGPRWQCHGDQVDRFAAAAAIADETPRVATPTKASKPRRGPTWRSATISDVARAYVKGAPDSEHVAFITGFFGPGQTIPSRIKKLGRVQETGASIRRIENGNRDACVKAVRAAINWAWPLGIITGAQARRALNSIVGVGSS